MNRFSIRRLNNSFRDSRRPQFSAKDTEVHRTKSKKSSIINRFLFRNLMVRMKSLSERN